MMLKNKRIAILAEDNYDVLELWYPCIRMKEEGVQVDIIGAEGKKSYASKEGKSVDVSYQAEDINAEDYDAVIIPGGMAPDRMRRHQAMLELVAAVHKKSGVIGFICHAGWVPISAKIVEGKTVTSTSAIKDDLINAGANWIDQDVVVDGNLISSRSPEDLPAFCKAIIKVLSD
jgi:protease I